ncbi:MAG: D-2-hydroxyacid dehydrogenase [Caldilineaceae bacterium]|nr:D-2-hydroxyacid dehydrogenase [Caldilineaceae bacterium]
MKTIVLGFGEDQLAQIDLNEIAAAAPGYELLVTQDRRQIEEKLSEIEIVFNSFPYDLVARAPNLRWIQQWGAGADWLLRYPAAVADPQLTVTNGSGIHPIPITEHIFGLILALGRRIHTQIRQQRHHQWQSMPGESLFELPGKTMVLIGVGAIGERTAQVATALGLRVLGVRRDPTQAVANVDAMYGQEALPTLLPQADFVVLTVPLTQETKHMIGEAELRAMKPSAYILNVGRGGTIDESALITALAEGWIAGAGLDVTEVEPLPPDSPLWEMDDVIITSHYAGATPRYIERLTALFLDNLRRYQAGEPLRNVVDKHLGY